MRDIDPPGSRIAGFGLTSPNAARLTEFYVSAFGAALISAERLPGSRVECEFGVRGGAWRHTLHLGREAVDIVEFDTPGRPYPCPLSPYDTAFQHFALVVSDMDLALAHLHAIPGWTPITNGGPQHLPQRSGGVTAFKFRDPDGHPLELLAFPKKGVPPHWRERSGRIFQGIDHSAISVRATAISTTFYQELGFTVTGTTVNHGVEQANLDAVPSPKVEVTALALDASTPHLELLCYRSARHSPRQALAGNDVAATRILLAAAGMANPGAAQRLVIDPDGHHWLVIE